MYEYVRFGLVGCGKIAAKHAEVLAQHVPGAKLVGVCDVDRTRATKFAEPYQIPAFGSMAEMIRRLPKPPDVLNILTPSGMHAPGILEALSLGCKNIVVEKPLALTLEDAETVVKACREYGANLFVVKQNRYNRPIQALRQALDSGRFGKLTMGNVCMRWCRTQSYYNEAPWRGTWALDGGVFANQAYHHIDLLRWLLGSVESVYAMTARRLANIEAEDTGVVVLRFTNGALGTIEATTATRPKDLEGSVTILGEKASVEIGGFSANKLTLWQFSEPLPHDEEIQREHGSNPPINAYGHVAYMNEVVRSVKTGKVGAPDGEEGLATLRLIHAIYQSALSGKPIFLSNFHRSTIPLGCKPVTHPPKLTKPDHINGHPFVTGAPVL
jgi:predicted dehydrogenase